MPKMLTSWDSQGTACRLCRREGHQSRKPMLSAPSAGVTVRRFPESKRKNLNKEPDFRLQHLPLP